MPKIFLTNLSCIDMSYVDCNTSGLPVGGSFSPSFEVEGPIDQIEQVVVDFGTIKKLIKQGLDTVLDHKFWIFPNTFEVVIDDGYVLGKNEAIEFRIPEDAAYIVPDSVEDLSSGSVQRVIEEEVNKFVRNTYPQVNITCINDEEFTFPVEDLIYEEFRYVHGLKKSTSKACQNILHGHLSYMAFKCGDDYSNEVEEYLQDLTEELNDCIFVFRENIVHEDHDNLTIKYTTERGDFELTLVKGLCSFIVLDVETTVENIAQWITDREYSVMRELDIECVYLSEGLSKGAVVEIK